MSKRRDDSKRSKKYRAGSFAISAMTCPGCRTIIEDPVESCPRCGYSGHSVVKKFPFAAPKIERYIDPGDHFGPADRERIDGALASLAKRFPQVRFCFCVIDLEPETDLREFGFWMLNASPIDGPGEEELRPWTILLLIDGANGRVSVTSGYAIEPFLNEERWLALLQFSGSLFARRDYGVAVLNFVEGAVGVLSEGAERTERRLSRGKFENLGEKGQWE
ncbi:MAG: hypothetical protein ABF379_16160 [Akkermansiaceae bacterium]